MEIDDDAKEKELLLKFKTAEFEYLTHVSAKMRTNFLDKTAGKTIDTSDELYKSLFLNSNESRINGKFYRKVMRSCHPDRCPAPDAYELCVFAQTLDNLESEVVAISTSPIDALRKLMTYKNQEKESLSAKISKIKNSVWYFCETNPYAYSMFK